MSILDPTLNFKPLESALVRHSLAKHPLLQMPRLLELALQLPPEQLRYYSGCQIPVTQNFETVAKTYPNGLSLEETLRHMETAGSYVFLRKVHTHPLYRDLMNEVVEDIEALIHKSSIGAIAGKKVKPQVERAEAWVFISSPGAVTPYHRDHESNFLLQISGKKNVNVWNPLDRSVCPEEESEFLHGEHSLEKTLYGPDYQPKAIVYELSAGQGAFMPFTAPHWVKNGDEVSISMSITYHTQETDRIRNIYRMNHALRKRGMTPNTVGQSPLLDSAKYLAYRNLLKAKRALNRSAYSDPATYL
ncbi:MAG: cupin-like domain-containing protein [Methylotenera sp.]|nr:cupin-like domain-containing protein [Oligoflexia bacterium]